MSTLYRFLRSGLMVLVFFLVAQGVQAQTGIHTYIISPNGNDTQCTGMSAAAYPGSGGPGLACAFKTLQKGATVAQAGDTVQILTGTYYQKFAPVNSGTATAYITYMPYPGAQVTIDGTGVSLSTSSYREGLVHIAGKSYIKIQGLTIKNSSVQGINVVPNSGGVRPNNIELSNNTILNTHTTGIMINRADGVNVKNNTIKHVDYSSGIGVWSSTHVTVDGNTIDTPHYYHECQGAYEEGLSIASVNAFEVKNNTLDYTETPPYPATCTNAQRLGIDVKESSQNGSVHHNTIHNFDASSIYVDGWHAGANGTATLNHVSIYQNYIYDSSGITVGCEQADGIVEYIYIYNNKLINARFAGIQVRGAYGDGLRKNIYIYNNTIYGAARAGGNGGAGIYVTTNNLLSNNSDAPVVIKNNISNFYFLSDGSGWVGQITAGDAAIATKVAASHNLVYGPLKCANDHPNCMEVGSRTTAAPSTLYTNISTTPYDLHLKTGAPAIDAGVAPGLAGMSTPLFTVDYDGVKRPQGSAFDVGTYEHSSLATPAPTSTPLPSASPLPLGDANGDGHVTEADYTIWLTHYGITNASSPLMGNFNDDTTVDGMDYVIWLNHTER